jgi:hypothetical protein
MKTFKQIELDQIYNSIVAAYQVSASDDEPNKIAKLLSQKCISEEGSKRYIAGLEQLVKDLKEKVSKLEAALKDSIQKE